MPVTDPKQRDACAEIAARSLSGAARVVVARLRYPYWRGAAHIGLARFSLWYDEARRCRRPNSRQSRCVFSIRIG